jgi:hypothetical protein
MSLAARCVDMQIRPCPGGGNRLNSTELIGLLRPLKEAALMTGNAAEDRCRRIKFYYDEYFTHCEVLDYARAIGLTVKRSDLAYCGRFSYRMTDGQIIDEMNRIIDGKSSEYAITPVEPGGGFNSD